MSALPKVLSNTAYQIIAKVLTALIGALTVKMLTNYFGAAVFGEYTFIYEYLAFFGIAADFGLFTIAIREMSKYEDDPLKVEKIFGNIFGLRIILTTLLMSLAVLSIFLLPMVSAKYNSEYVSIGVMIAVFSTFFTIINGTMTSILQAKLKMFYSMLAQMLGKIIIFSYMLFTVFYIFPKDPHQGFVHILLAGVIGNFCMMVYTYFQSKKLVKIKIRFDWDYYKEILLKSLPYGLALILNTIYFRIDSVILYIMKGPIEVGVYGVAMRILEIISAIPLYFMNSVLPSLSKSIHNKDGEHQSIIQISFDVLVIMSLPVLIGGFVLAYPIIFAIASPEFLSRVPEGFYGSDIALQILMFATVFQFLNTLFVFTIIAIDKQSKILMINSIVVLFNIISNIIVIPYYGFRGAAVTSILSEAFILIFAYLIVKQHLSFNINIKRFIKSLFCAIGMGLFVYLLRDITYLYLENFNLLILIPMGGIIYGSLLLITKTVDINMIKGALKKN